MFKYKESQNIELKEELNLNPNFEGSQKNWLVLIKAIIAMANSGGGKIYIGVRNDGSFSGADTSSIIDTDPVDFTKKIGKYTGIPFHNFSIREQNDNGNNLVVIEVEAFEYPLIFEKEGVYKNSVGKDITIFQAGTLYMRKGAQSTIAGSNDIKNFIDKKLKEQDEKRLDWVSGQFNALSTYYGDEQIYFAPDIVYINVREHKLEIAGKLVNRKSPRPSKVWLTTYIFQPDDPGAGSSSIEPIEINNPFENGDIAEINVSNNIVCSKDYVEARPVLRSRSHVSSKSRDLAYVQSSGRLKTFEGSLLVLYKN